MDNTASTFEKLPVFLKVLIIIGSITTFILLVLIIIVVSLTLENSPKKEHIELDEYDDFLNEFKTGVSNDISKDIVVNEVEYPLLPKIKDFKGQYLKNLLQIELA